MADEFAKGLGALTGAGLIWMVLAGWYKTPSFDGPQLSAAPPEQLGMYGGIALVLLEAMFWTAIIGALAFWVLIPAGRELYATYSGD